MNLKKSHFIQINKTIDNKSRAGLSNDLVLSYDNIYKFQLIFIT